MVQAAAIVVGAVLVAAAIMVTNHWTLQTGAADFTTAVRLNRWTGSIDICFLDPSSIAAGAKSLAGARLECTRP
jgi:hypothetical protein